MVTGETERREEWVRGRWDEREKLRFEKVKKSNY